MKVFINYKQAVEPDHEFAKRVEITLRDNGHQVFRDETNLKASEEWPKRLEAEVRSCNAMVSLLSNASLNSLWVLNEIDLARDLGKRIVPILLEDIDQSLNFRVLRPRFMSTQWYRATDKIDDDLATIVDLLSESRHECYRDLLDEKLDEYQISDGRELIESLFGVLWQQQWPYTTLGSPGLYDIRNREGKPEPSTLARALSKSIDEWASVCQHNSDNYHKHGDETAATRLAWQTQRLRCLHSILEEAISAWDSNSLMTRAKLEAAGDLQRPLFDVTDGEAAFASKYNNSILPTDKPVPKNTIAQMHNASAQNTAGGPGGA